MIRLFKVKDRNGMWTSHSKGLLESQLEFFKGLTSENRLVVFLDDDGHITLRLSKFGAVKDEDPTREIQGA